MRERMIGRPVVRSAPELDGGHRRLWPISGKIAAPSRSTQKRCSFQSELLTGRAEVLSITGSARATAGKHLKNSAQFVLARERPGDLTENHERQVGMNRHRIFLVFVTLATAAATPALAQTATPVVGAASSATNGAASIPNFSRVWNHPSFPWFEPPASGPGPVTNRSRWPQRPSGPGGSVAVPPTKEGVSNYDQLVGDYTNPILQPWAAEVVKKFGEMSLSGITYPNPSNQCWPEPMPFIYKQFTVQIIQQPDKITFFYSGNNDVRHVRLNQRHREPLTPSWFDTVGVKTDRPYAMIDLFGTPYSKALHIVERYRLREYDDVKDAIERYIKENWLFAGDVFSKHRGKFLQLHLTIEDEGVFTMPWTATLTYVPGPDQFPEVVCAENRRRYYETKEVDVPRAEKPDF